MKTPSAKSLLKPVSATMVVFAMAVSGYKVDEHFRSPEAPIGSGLMSLIANEASSFGVPIEIAKSPWHLRQYLENAPNGSHFILADNRYGQEGSSVFLLKKDGGDILYVSTPASVPENGFARFYIHSPAPVFIDELEGMISSSDPRVKRNSPSNLFPDERIFYDHSGNVIFIPTESPSL